MLTPSGTVVEERATSNTPMFGGRRMYDIRIRPRIIVTWLTILALSIGAMSTCLNWLGLNIADWGPGAQMRRVETRLSALEASQDTMKQSLIIFADQFCGGPAAKSRSTQRRCDQLFGEEEP